MASMRDRLRRETNDIHQRLHGHVCFQSLLNKTISKPEYINLLARFLGYHKGLESGLSTLDDPNSDLAYLYQARSQTLGADLTCLGLTTHQIAQLSTMPTMHMRSTHDAMGSLYVREGAMIGGRSLARNLDHLLGQGVEGRTFFTGIPNDSVTWRRLCTALDLIEDPTAQDRAIASANATFCAFETWMDGMERFCDKGV